MDLGRGLSIGVAQLDLDVGQIDGNLERTTGAVAALASDGAQLVVLPELSDTGFVLDPDQLRAVCDKSAGGQRTIEAWSEAARRHRVTVVGGLAEVAGEHVYNAAVVIGPDGALVGTYRKLHLFGKEADAFTPGDRGVPVFDMGTYRLAVLVCYDLRFPEAMRIAALQGADVVAVPTAWVTGFDRGATTWSIPQVDAAIVQANLNQVFVVCAGRVGEDDGLAFLGRSVVVSPFGGALTGPLDADRPALAVIEVDVDDARRAQERSARVNPRRQRRTDVYGELLGYVPPPPLDPG